MKKILLFVVVGIVALFVVCYFIPVKKEKEIFVASTFQNIISSVSQPANWVKWYPPAMEIWQKDSSTYTFKIDSSNNISNINANGKKIKVTQLTALLYEVEEDNNPKSLFGLSVIPYVGNNQMQSEHNSRIAYAWRSNLLFYLLPFLEDAFANTVVDNLRAYLESPLRFYGFDIALKQTTDTIFVTQNENCTQQELFTKLPVLFGNLEKFAQKKQVNWDGNKNVAYTFLNNDSLYVVAGININKVVDGEFVTNVMQLPGGQILAVGRFEGIFRDRLKLYKAMRLYLADHQLQLMGASFEKYLSALPKSENDSVKIDICFPLRQY